MGKRYLHDKSENKQRNDFTVEQASGKVFFHCIIYETKQ
jgi:hypothetical protein